MSAEVPPAGISTMSLPAWWGAPGRPGFVPDAALAGGMPWTIAGLTAGAWDLRDPFAPAALPEPGVAEAQVPMAWYDSAAVVLGENAAWRGFGASLASAEGFVNPPGSRPRAVLSLVSGEAAVDRDGIFIGRGNSRTWLRTGAVADKRGGIGDLDLGANHLWMMDGGRRAGHHTFEGGFEQRGMGERQRAGVGESARGMSGRASWTWAHGTDALAARLERGFDTRVLVPVGSGVSPARRESEQNQLELTARRAWQRDDVALRLSLISARVIRSVDVPVTRPARQEWSTRSWWLSARGARPLGEGTLEVQLGGGMDRSAVRREERRQLAPGIAWRAGAGARRVRLFAERIVNPVWSDLDPFTPAFVQDTWTGGFDATIGRPDSAHAGLQLLAGRTGNRATLLRYPVRDEELFVGWQRDDRRYDFLLAQLSAAARWRALDFDATGYALVRDRGSSQPRVDPGTGARVGAGCAFRLFANDLGVHLRVQGAWVGERETDTRVIEDITLPGYATVGGAATLTLGDATIVLRADGLENARRPESWIDPSQINDFVLARDSGRQFRMELVWPLFN